MKKNNYHYLLSVLSLSLSTFALVYSLSGHSNLKPKEDKVFHYLDFVTWDSFYGLCEGVIESQDFDGNYIIITNHCSRKHVKGETFRVASKYLTLVY